MSKDQRDRAKTGFEQVRAILHGEWDPIGCGVPEDEYDSYVWPTLKLLMANAPRAEVEGYLREAAKGMACSVPDKRLNSVLDHLFELKIG